LERLEWGQEERVQVLRPMSQLVEEAFDKTEVAAAGRLQIGRSMVAEVEHSQVAAVAHTGSRQVSKSEWVGKRARWVGNLAHWGCNCRHQRWDSFGGSWRCESKREWHRSTHGGQLFLLESVRVKMPLQ
jgi:hypothetical protein